jgi:hypothetical protein
MSCAFDLWSVDDVRTHAAGILERLRNGSMPCDGAWPEDRIAVFHAGPNPVSRSNAASRPTQVCAAARVEQRIAN